MKQLDWKSFAIGVLLTTTVMLGTGAATDRGHHVAGLPDGHSNWDAHQQWKVVQTGVDASVTGQMGYEPFQVKGNQTLWRMRINPNPAGEMRFENPKRKGVIRRLFEKEE
jgi:hypothetical protein